MPHDWAWAAGIFEGEGSITCWEDPNSPAIQRRVSVRMTDRDVLETFLVVVGVGTIGKVEHGNRRKPIYTWRAGSRADIEHVLSGILPYLHARRRAAAEHLLANPAGISGWAAHTHCNRGHEFVEGSYYLWRNSRHCKACKKLRREQAKTGRAA